MEVSDVVNALDLQNAFANAICADIFWRGLHEDGEDVTEHVDGREKNNHGEDIGANWIHDLVVWIEVNNHTSSDYSDRLEKITNHVNDCSPNIDIALFALLQFVLLTLSETSQKFLGLLGSDEVDALPLFDVKWRTLSALL